MFSLKKVILTSYLVFHTITLFSQSIDTTLFLSYESIYFESNSSELDSISIEKLTSIRLTDPSFLLYISGHTDADGPKLFNQGLSKKRVESVEAFLINTIKIDKSKIRKNHHGEEKPSRSNITAQGKSLNRRVEIYTAWKTRMSAFSGKISSDSMPFIGDGKVFINTKNYRDSILIKDGIFSGLAPENTFIRLHIAADKHFYKDTILKINRDIRKNNVHLSLPYLKPGQQYILPDFFFVSNRPIQLEKSLSSLDALRYSMVHSSICIIIEGHVNAPTMPPKHKNSFEYRLSVDRANLIKTFLIKSKVDSMRLNSIGYSNFYMRHPKAKSAKDQAENRRVEIFVKKCNNLFDYTQDHVIPPAKTGTHKRLHLNR